MISVRGVSKQFTRGQEGGKSLHGGLAALTRMARRQPADPTTGQRDTFWALNDVSFDIRYGERVGIIGRNGAGKSTLLKILSRVTYPTAGEARVRGRLVSLLEIGTGFIGDLSGRENVYLNASIHVLSRVEIQERFAEIVAFSGVEDFLDTPVKWYSSGMRMRLAFSVAVHLNPDILILDEVLTVGDLDFQRKGLERVQQLVSEGRTLLFVSHSTDSLAKFCDRCIWLDHGRVRGDGPTSEILEQYRLS
jgi:lipopolysaccharide transport system ATP-binding protein